MDVDNKDAKLAKVQAQLTELMDVVKEEHKALYGTKQAARCWWKHLSGTLAALGYKSSYHNSSVYTKQQVRQIHHMGTRERWDCDGFFQRSTGTT
ncbi:hypothetical protein PGT21_016593 [Puccinia graminis f. sp. tritici]|uniref:Uncharacterized protein n=1 Tax=Puccinia graminis f. sp. tritici TaxID=56615 RepID=A0A5B0QXH0_PUCGR|nr:hypothetical protein PGT21_016593 [Puccinia graminis f. sp. tritici]